MKRFLLTILLAFVLISCSDALSKEECLKSVKKVFPNAKIYTKAGGSNMEFIVIDSTNVYRVTTASSLSAEITSVEVLELRD